MINGEKGRKKHISTLFNFSSEAILPIGDPIQIEWDEKKYISVLRGALFSKYVLIDIPEKFGKKVTFDYSAVLLIRFLVSGTVYGFKTGITGVYKHPQIMSLEYPQNIENHTLRKSDRMNVMLPVRINSNNLKEPVEGATIDLSTIGTMMVINGEEDFEKDDRVTISISLPDGTNIESVACDVCNSRKEDGKTFFGVKFHDSKDSAVKSVVNFYKKCFSYQYNHK